MVWVLTMKCKKHVLYSWQEPQELGFKIAWAEAAQHLGLELARWIRELDPMKGLCYLYVNPSTHSNQLMLETFDDIIEQEFIYRSSHLRINTRCEQKNSRS